MDREELITALGLDADADDGAILAATAAITLSQPAARPASPSRVPSNPTSSRPTEHGRTAGNPPESKSDKKARKLAKKQALALSEEEQSTTLSAEQTAKLLIDANHGAAAHKQLAEERLQSAWQKALTEGRAAPSQEETIKELHQLDPDLAIKTLDSFVKIVPTKPAGSGEGVGQSGPAPLGMDEDRFQLHSEAKALAAKKLADDPTLDDGEAYVLAVTEIEDRKFTLENPGI